MTMRGRLARPSRSISTVLAEGGRSFAAACRLSGVTDEELIEGLSFSADDRVSTVIFVPGPSGFRGRDGAFRVTPSTQKLNTPKIQSPWPEGTK